ncbi:hypothetical protein QR78_16555 [Methylobacterium indicum]|uniref:Uncharacterized protein n=2 Tax=Methylobacterium indicum TaxID=1775910 RepID=A0ABR5HEE9_9HYPH|nr:hypothetical protein QR78_16555 [Methylobacterium indicum]KMO24847.1 hypothetical protein QR79_10240 [Methylobacterium indicum]
MAGVLARTPRMRASLLLAAVAGGLALAVPAPVRAQSTGNNCLVRQAADAAVQRQIALIDAAKVNPSSFFNGPNSCIAGDLLKRFDLSNLIPDIQSAVTGEAIRAVTSLLDQAKRQVCQILDQQLMNTIGSINSQMRSFQSSISGDLFRQLNGSISPITLPKIANLGQYTHVTNEGTGSALNLPQTQTSIPAVQTDTSQSNTSSTIVIPQSSGTKTGSGYEGIMR